MRVLHIPFNTPYIHKLDDEPQFIAVNNRIQVDGRPLPSDMSYAWILEHLDDQAFTDSFDILHLHYGFEFEDMDLINLVLRRLSGKGIVFTCHETHSVHASPGYERYLRFMLSRADQLMTLTEGAAIKITRLLTEPKPITVAPHGYAMDPRSPWFGGAGGSSVPEVVMYGALRPNRDTLTTIANLLMGCVPDCHAQLLTRPIRDEAQMNALLPLANLARNNDYGQIELSLPLSDESLAERLASCDILVLPYLNAGHSGALEMAFDMGLLPVVTNVGHLPEQVEHWRLSDPDIPAVIVDWSDGKTWLYQQRLMDGIRSACGQIRRFNSADIADTRRAFRLEEHRKSLQAHDAVYRAALA